MWIWLLFALLITLVTVCTVDAVSFLGGIPGFREGPQSSDLGVPAGSLQKKLVSTPVFLESEQCAVLLL